MLVLSTLHKLLAQALARDVGLAALLTPSGQLVACAYADGRSKDDVRVVVGLASEMWAEVRATAAAESEVRHSRVFLLDEKRLPVWAAGKNRARSCRRPPRGRIKAPPSRHYDLSRRHCFSAAVRARGRTAGLR